MLSRRSLVAGAVRVKLGNYGESFRTKQTSDVANDAGWVVGMMQNHCDQRRMHVNARQLQSCGVRDKSFDVRDATFFLQPLQVSQGIGRTIDRIDGTRWANPIGEHQANITGSRSDL